MQQKEVCPLCRSSEHIVNITNEIQAPVIIVNQRQAKIIRGLSFAIGFVFTFYTVSIVLQNIK